VSETIKLQSGLNKQEKYQELFPQLVALTAGESDSIANCANIVAALKEAFGFFWVGIYFVKPGQSAGEELVLGPFQGPVACVRIGKGKGVCGTSWELKKPVIVPDVDKFPGHIACNASSRSEIVIPVIRNNSVIAILDVDSDSLKAFDETDQYFLLQVAELLSSLL
jgi:L-methionine (R)-S-oxide reductase